MASEPKGSVMELHAHGDGTYHTIARGSGYQPYSEGKEPGRVDHESFGAAMMHMAKHHAEGDHMHILSHDTGFTTHHVMEGGAIKGPHEHETLGALKKHISSAMDEDGDEG